MLGILISIAPCLILLVLALFMINTIEFKWDLFERTKRNSEDWDLNEGKESGIDLKFDCVKSFMDTIALNMDLTLR